MTTGAFVSTTCLADCGYAETLDAYRDVGIERVELGYCPDPLDVGEIVDSYPFEFVAHNYCLPTDEEFILNLASQDDSIRRRSVRYIEDAIEFCDRHGIDLYSFHAGFRVDPTLSLVFSGTDIPDYETSFETFVMSLCEIVEFAASYDVSLAVENNVVAPRNVADGDPLLLCAEPGEFERVFERVGGDRLSALLDVGHLKISARTLGFDAARFVDEVAPRVTAVHLHANDGSADQHRPSRPGDVTHAFYRRFPDATTSVEASFASATRLREYLDSLTSPTAT